MERCSKLLLPQYEVRNDLSEGRSVFLQLGIGSHSKAQNGNTMPRSKYRTPQEKKQLSLQKDYRDDYGNYDKASRRAIPLWKKKSNRALRRCDKVDIRIDYEKAESGLPKRLKSRWRKYPGQSLGIYIEKKKERRRQRHGRKSKSAKTNMIRLRYGKGELSMEQYLIAWQETWHHQD